MNESERQSRYVYHRVPADLRGSILYPLNQLENRVPDLHAALKQNYSTRLDIAALRIPPLGDCLWNDVLHFCPVHPARIKAALAEAGHSLPDAWRRFYQVDARLLDPSATVLYQLLQPFWSGRFNIDEASAQIGRECLPFRPELLDVFAEVPRAARAYYESVSPGSPVILFLGVPHVLYKGELDVHSPGVSIIEV